MMADAAMCCAKALGNRHSGRHVIVHEPGPDIVEIAGPCVHVVDSGNEVGLTLARRLQAIEITINVAQNMVAEMQAPYISRPPSVKSRPKAEGQVQALRPEERSMWQELCSRGNLTAVLRDPRGCVAIILSPYSYLRPKP